MADAPLAAFSASTARFSSATAASPKRPWSTAPARSRRGAARRRAGTGGRDRPRATTVGRRHAAPQSRPSGRPAGVSPQTRGAIAFDIDGQPSAAPAIGGFAQIGAQRQFRQRNRAKAGSFGKRCRARSAGDWISAQAVQKAKRPGRRSASAAVHCRRPVRCGGGGWQRSEMRTKVEHDHVILELAASTSVASWMFPLQRSGRPVLDSQRELIGVLVVARRLPGYGALGRQPGIADIQVSPA